MPATSCCQEDRHEDSIDDNEEEEDEVMEMEIPPFAARGRGAKPAAVSTPAKYNMYTLDEIQKAVLILSPADFAAMMEYNNEILIQQTPRQRQYNTQQTPAGEDDEFAVSSLSSLHD